MSDIRTFKVLDLFCGTGAISYGLNLCDKRFTVVAGIDSDPAACATAAANHSEARIICTPIESLPPDQFVVELELDKIDMIVGGPPCQGFSSLRPNRQTNINDPRNRLYRYFIDYVRKLQPTVFLMENVVGLVSQSDGSLLRSILLGFRQLGYEVDWRVLNAAHYGVPQKRERVIIVGVHSTASGSPTIDFPEPSHYFAGRVIGTKAKDHYITNTSHGSPALTADEAISDLPPLKSGDSSTQYASPPSNAFQAERRARSNGHVSLHSAANHSAKMQLVMKHAGASRDALPPEVLGLLDSGFSSCYSRIAAAEPAPTITVKFTSPASSKCIHPHQPRAITPREAARLQGFDDHFLFRGTKSQIASQIGNAVPPLLGKALAPMFVERLGG